ncbi:hypothetical protein AB205_0058900, partial [Aquarana catesbeiana]
MRVKYAAFTMFFKQTLSKRSVCMKKDQFAALGVMIDILEKQRERAFSQRAFCIQCCWRRYRQRKLARQRRAATAIQAVARGWLTRKHIERMHRASAVIKRAWKKWKRPIKFHCKKSPLHFANVCPEAFDCGLTGLN